MDVDELVIEPAIELPSTMDHSVRWRIYGRLILREDALYFIHGWDTKGRDVWRILDGALDRLVHGTMGTHAGAQMLAKYADRPAPEQARIIPDSRVLSCDDISGAFVHGFRPKLVVETQRRGDRFTYRIPRWARAEAGAWAEAR